MKDSFIFFSEADFMPHGHCYYWEPYILWSHAISDGIIALAYCVIPPTLLYIYLKRKDFKYIWMMGLFAIFIFGCGMTHVMDVITIWNPLYRLDSIFRIVTALASVGTALVLIKITPDILLIPTAEQWIRLNEALKAQILELQEKDRTIEAFREFEYLTETLPQLVWTNMPDGTASYFNQRWYLYTGLDFTPDLLASLEKVIYADQLLPVKDTWQAALQNGTIFEMEMLVRRHDGTYRWHLGRAVPIKKAGKIRLWVSTLTDIHDQKRHTQELEAKNQELIVINRDLDNFIYTASHDLKAPIANVEGLTRVLVKRVASSPDEEQNTILQHITESVKRLKGTVRDLTEIAKVQKEIHDDIAMVPLRDMLEEVKQDINALITESAASIIARFEVPQLQMAPKNVRSIFYNLLTNAIKYRSPQRPLRILIETRYQEQYIVLSVIDNGIGIDPSLQHKLFTMFKRLHTHVEGTGIGLYIVKRIIENYGGKVAVESDLDQGTTFRLFFPVKGHNLRLN